MTASATTVNATLRDAIDVANRRFESLFNGGDPAGAAESVYSRDARVLPPGGPLTIGREAITKFWQAAAQQMGISRVALSTLELQALGDGAYEIGRAKLSLTSNQTADVKYVVVWKQEEGRWCWHVDIWNAD